jgi:D-glycero-alpha-D-manno-heptose-7-phosphate kinase
VIITRAPFRVTLGGGGTDLPSFYSKHGGFVFTMAIDKYMHVFLKSLLFREDVIVKYRQTEQVAHASELKHDRAREVLLRHGITSGIEVNSLADLPAESGLGSSSSYLVALSTAVRHMTRQNSSPGVVASEACDIEINTLGQPVGKQDQYIAAYGGLRVLEIDSDGTVHVRTPNVSQSDAQELVSRAHIYFTGRLRSASDILREQNRLAPQVENSLLQIRDLGHEFLEAAESGNFDQFGLLLDTHWQLKKQLSSRISLGFLDELYETVKADYGVLGGKIIGAGGGGFFMAFCGSSGGNRNLEQFMSKNGMPRLHYAVDYQGAKVLADFGS